jgi:hypothetical protein
MAAQWSILAVIRTARIKLRVVAVGGGSECKMGNNQSSKSLTAVG